MKIPGAGTQRIREVAARKQPVAAGLPRIIQNLLHNRLARYYFESGITSEAYKSIKELLQAPNQFLAISIEVDIDHGIGDIDNVADINSLPKMNQAKRFYIKRAATTILAFLKTVKTIETFQKELDALIKLGEEGNHEIFITEFFKKSNGFFDLGKFIDATMFPLQYADMKGDYAAAIQHFLSLYFVLRTGHLISGNTPEHEAEPIAINPPVQRAEILPEKSAPEDFTIDYVNPDLFEKAVKPLWSTAVRAKARKFMLTLSRLNSKQMPEPVRLAVEQGVRDYMEIRDRRELSQHYEALIDSIKTNDPNFKEDNIFVSEQAYRQTADRVLNIIDSGTVPSQEELAILTQRMALTLILIAGRNS